MSWASHKRVPGCGLICCGLLSVCLAACMGGGEIWTDAGIKPDGGFDAGADPGQDAGGGDPFADAGDPGPDGGDVVFDGGDPCEIACQGLECGPDSCGGSCGNCSAGSVCADGFCQAEGSCANVTCADTEWCEDGVCRCQSGWERQGIDCAAIVPPDPTITSRSQQQVCDKWNLDYANQADWVWEADADTCADGDMNPASIDDGIRRLNLYRWLTGLHPTFNQRSHNAYAQPCAVIMQANGDLNHYPPDTWDCYSAEGASGAGHSNLAGGAWDPANAMELYLADNGVASLGHRRWLLDPPYQSAGIGHAGRWNCTYVMTYGNDYRPAYVAFPPPGPYPAAGLLGPWSLGATAYDANSLAVSVTDLSTGDVQQLAFEQPGGSYGSLSYLSFRPSGVSAGNDYQVEITGVRLIGGAAYETLTYMVQVVDCN